MKLNYKLAIAAFAMAVPGVATAQAGPSLSVKAEVTASCSYTTSEVNFAQIDSLRTTSSQALGDLLVTCSNGTPWTFAADTGWGSDESGQRRMQAVLDSTYHYLAYEEGD